MNHTLSDSQLESMIKSAVNSSGPLPPDEKFSQLVSALRELQERRKADSEPVAIVEPSDYVTAAQLVGEESLRKAVRELYEGALRIGDKLYRHSQQPVVPDESYQQLSELYHAQEKRLFKIAQRIKGPAFDKYSHSPSQAIDVLEVAIFGDDESCRAAMLAAAPQSPGIEPATVPGKWIPVSERMPDDEQEVLTINKMGHRFVSFFDKHSGLFFDRLDAPAACCIEHVLVTHWMPLPAAPQEVK